jgi:hypothetical protein
MSVQQFSDWLLLAPPWSRTSYFVGELACACDREVTKQTPLGGEVTKLRTLVYNSALAGKVALFQRRAYAIGGNVFAFDYLALNLPIRKRTRDDF